MTWYACAWPWLTVVLVTVTLVSGGQDALGRARLMAENGETSRAIRFLESRTRREPAAPELAFLAQLHASTGAIPQAVDALERAVVLAPRQVGLRITLGAMLFELRRFDEAASLLERVIREAPDAALAHYYFAAVSKARGELELAAEVAARAVSLTPPDGAVSPLSEGPPPAAAVRHLLAEIRVEQGKAVEPLLREVIAIDPFHASAHYLLGRVLKDGGRDEEARSELAIFETIKRAEGHIERAQDLARVGAASAEILAELRSAVEAGPYHTRALYLLGANLLAAGRRDEAEAVLERAVDASPSVGPEVRRLLDASR